MRPAAALFTLAISLAAAVAGAAPAEVTVLPERVDGVARHEVVDAYLKQEAFAALDRRAAEYEKLKTPEQLAAYQERVRAFFREQLGEVPEKTPLNARVVGREARDGYRVEKVIYESRPGFHVTAILYLPEAPPPFPGVLFPCGHSENGKAAEAYQRACILLAKHGMAVLCFDPIGQGERKQVLDAAGKPPYRATSEHSLVSCGTILVGRNVASYMVWDGIRGIDYLLSRPEIDPKRIGCTGNSGGGTQTSYLMALDDRIAVAAPSCYLTTFRRLLQTIGPQDAEQNIHGQLAFGMDHADYVLMRAPKPTLMCVATRDFFDIGGAWDTFRQAKRFYGRLGHPERIELAEADEQHGFTRPLREAAARWMRRWLLGRDDAVIEPDFPIATDEQLQCTPRGQVLHLEGARSVIDLNRELAERLAPERQRFWETAGKINALAEVRKLAGIRPLREIPSPTVEKRGSVASEGLRIDRLVLRGDDGIPLPALWCVPPNPVPDIVLYVNPAGKDPRGEPAFAEWIRARRRVLAVDLRGFGELQARNAQGQPAGTSYADVVKAYLLGRSYLGMRAEDVLRAARFLAGEGTDGPPRIHLIAAGEAGPPALHAAALEPETFAGVQLSGSIESWADVVRAREPRNQRSNVVHGALRRYDLPDLAAVLGNKLVVTQPAAADGGAAR
jgi:cephalosporin-C deacetylase-like acetyl esterase